MPDSPVQLEVALVAAAGAFLVACIAGGFSLLGLIISKEQQVSGFRQVWIDALRADIASFVARAHQIQSYVKGHQPLRYTDFWKATHDDYIALNETSTRIKLRLNWGEPESQIILGLMNKMEGLFDKMGDPTSSDQIKHIVDDLERAGPPLLQKEWKRVKQGELTYRVAKVFALSIFACAAAIVGFLLGIIHG
jgi:hypothetical protein